MKSNEPDAHGSGGIDSKSAVHVICRDCKHGESLHIADTLTRAKTAAMEAEIEHAANTGHPGLEREVVVDNSTVERVDDFSAVGGDD